MFIGFNIRYQLPDNIQTHEAFCRNSYHVYVIKCLLDCMLRSASLGNVVDTVIWLILKFWLVDETPVLVVVLWLILFFSFDDTSMFKVVLWLMLEFSSLGNTLVSKVELGLVLKSIPVNETSVPKVGLSGVLMPNCVVSVANTVIVAVSVFVKHNHMPKHLHVRSKFSHECWLNRKLHLIQNMWKGMKKKGYHKIVYSCSYQTSSDYGVPFQEDKYNAFQGHADF